MIFEIAGRHAGVVPTDELQSICIVPSCQTEIEGIQVG